MKPIVVVGAGKIGATIADFLSATGDYAVTVVDRDSRALAELKTRLGVAILTADLTDRSALAGHLKGAIRRPQCGTLSTHRRHRRGCRGGSNPLSRSHRRRLDDAPGQVAGKNRHHRVHSPMRSGARVYFDRRL